MFEGFCEITLFIPKPIACVLSNIKLAVRISSLTVPSGFIVRAGTEYRSVILRYVKINCPGAKSGCNFFETFG